MDFTFVPRQILEALGRRGSFRPRLHAPGDEDAALQKKQMILRRSHRKVDQDTEPRHGTPPTCPLMQPSHNPPRQTRLWKHVR